MLENVTDAAFDPRICSSMRTIAPVDAAAAGAHESPSQVRTSARFVDSLGFYKRLGCSSKPLAAFSSTAPAGTALSSQSRSVALECCLQFWPHTWEQR